MRQLLLVVFAFMLGAGINPLSGKDGYIFRKKEFTQDTVVVTLVTHRTQYQFDQAANRERIIVPRKEKLAAFALISPDNKKCTIHAIDPNTRYEPEYLGHELVHCFYGRWHD